MDMDTFEKYALLGLELVHTNFLLDISWRKRLVIRNPDVLV